MLENRAFCGFPAGESERKREIGHILRIIKKLPPIFPKSITFLQNKNKSRTQSEMGRIFLCSDYGGAGFLLKNRAFCGFPAGESEQKREIGHILRIIKNRPQIFPKI